MPTPRQVLDLLKLDYIERTNRLMMHCPFHHDTDPSSGFYEDTEFFHCYSCDYHFDVFSFYAMQTYGEVTKATREEAYLTLTKRFGEHKERADPAFIAKLANVSGRVERELKPLRDVLGMQDYGHLSELADRFLILHQRGKREKCALDTDLELWLDCVKECTNAGYQPNPGSPPRARLHGWLQERVADVPGDDGSGGSFDLD